MRPFGKLFAAAAANVLNLTGSHVKKNYQKKEKKNPEQPHEEMTINIHPDDYEKLGEVTGKKAYVLWFVDIVVGTVDLTVLGASFLSTLVRKEPGAAPKNLSEKLTSENLVEDFVMICDNNYKKKNSMKCIARC